MMLQLSNEVSVRRDSIRRARIVDRGLLRGKYLEVLTRADQDLLSNTTRVPLLEVHDSALYHLGLTRPEGW